VSGIDSNGCCQTCNSNLQTDLGGVTPAAGWGDEMVLIWHERMPLLLRCIGIVPDIKPDGSGQGHACKTRHVSCIVTANLKRISSRMEVDGLLCWIMLSF